MGLSIAKAMNSPGIPTLIGLVIKKLAALLELTSISYTVELSASVLSVNYQLYYLYVRLNIWPKLRLLRKLSG